MERNNERRSYWSTNRILLVLQMGSGLILAGTLAAYLWTAAEIYLLEVSLQIAFASVVVLVCAVGLNYFLDRRSE